LLYIAASIEQYCDITRLIALPENEGILELAIGVLDQSGQISDGFVDGIICDKRV
jgi:hypothetical protein